jgi:polyribonucleotide nucleotidyltransferase
MQCHIEIWNQGGPITIETIMQTQSFTMELGGKTLTAEFTDLTGQANGSVMMKYGETVTLVTAVMSDKEQPNLPYFPLSVEFEERFYAAGAILGSRFIRREGRPSDEAVLSARIIDRTIRPLFNHHLRNDIQIVVTVLAMGEDDPDVLGVIGTSLALGVSDIPWNGPVGAIRIARNKATGAISINPTYVERVAGELEFEVLACGKGGTINMIETASSEVPEGDIIAVLEAATILHGQIEQFQHDIIAEIGKPKREVAPRILSEQLVSLFTNSFSDTLRSTLFSGKTGKSHVHELKQEFMLAVKALEEPVPENYASDYFEEMVDAEIHRGAIERGERADGRDFNTLRPLFAQAGGISPVLHGSGIFYRGETHMLSVLTLGGPESAQTIDSIEERDSSKRFMHHYNFPPFSVGETGRVGGYNRRMIGHGALAEKALLPIIPSKTEFPYTIRLVSETMSSNGSSSMGSVCGSTLALMDGGVPITRPVAGIASGVMMDGDRYVLLTDIQGPEDEHGDMDFKVAGTALGITAIQMDVKVGGVTLEILEGALEHARVARLQILDTLKNAIREPRPNISPRAPEIISLVILPDQIGLVIGGGGKTITKIKEMSGVDEITIEDDGTVFITGRAGSAKRAATAIRSMTKIYTLGDTLSVTITRIATFGAFAKMDDYHEGLIHISEIAPWRLESLDGVLKEGDTVDVTVVKVEEGKIGLSIKRRNPEWTTEKGLKQ